MRARNLVRFGVGHLGSCFGSRLNGPLALLNMLEWILPFGEAIQHGHPWHEG